MKRAEVTGQRSQVWNELSRTIFFFIKKKEDERQLVPYLCPLPSALCPAEGGLSEGAGR